jgi:hypothetical protein
MYSPCLAGRLPLDWRRSSHALQSAALSAKDVLIRVDSNGGGVIDANDQKGVLIGDTNRKGITAVGEATVFIDLKCAQAIERANTANIKDRRVAFLRHAIASQPNISNGAAAPAGLIKGCGDLADDLDLEARPGMTVKNRPPAGAPYIWLTRELLASDAWRSLGINSRRFIDFLLIQQMGKGGQENGRLIAPDRQLRAFGIGEHQVSTAIKQVEAVGLVDCFRGGMRVATRYALTWFPLHDGTPATNHWRAYRNPDLPCLLSPKSRNLPAKQQADRPKTLPAKQQVLSREALSQDGAVFSIGEGPERER